MPSSLCSLSYCRILWYFILFCFAILFLHWTAKRNKGNAEGKDVRGTKRIHLFQKQNKTKQYKKQKIIIQRQTKKWMQERTQTHTQTQTHEHTAHKPKLGAVVSFWGVSECYPLLSPSLVFPSKTRSFTLSSFATTSPQPSNPPFTFCPPPPPPHPPRPSSLAFLHLFPSSHEGEEEGQRTAVRERER